MRKQFAEFTNPVWADGLPEDVITTVRHEAMRLGIPSIELVKKWTLEAARNLCGSTAAMVTDSGAKPEGGEA